MAKNRYEFEITGKNRTGLTDKRTHAEYAMSKGEALAQAKKFAESVGYFVKILSVKPKN